MKKVEFKRRIEETNIIQQNCFDKIFSALRELRNRLPINSKDY